MKQKIIWVLFVATVFFGLFSFELKEGETLQAASKAITGISMILYGASIIKTQQLKAQSLITLGSGILIWEAAIAHDWVIFWGEAVITLNGALIILFILLKIFKKYKYVISYFTLALACVNLLLQWHYEHLEITNMLIAVGFLLLAIIYGFSLIWKPIQFFIAIFYTSILLLVSMLGNFYWGFSSFNVHEITVLSVFIFLNIFAVRTYWQLIKKEQA